MTEKEQIQQWLNQGEILKAEQALGSVRQMDAELLILNTLLQVFRVEAEQDIAYTVFDVSVDIHALARHFIKVKLLLRRLEFELPQVYQNELYLYCTKKHVSEYLLVSILLTNILHRKQVCRKLVGMFPDKAAYFEQAYSYLEEAEHG